MKAEAYTHTPVLLEEAVAYLDAKDGKVIIDATLGGGGYSQAILGAIGEKGKLLSIDLDNDAVENARIQKEKLKVKRLRGTRGCEGSGENWTIVHGNFKDIDRAVINHSFTAPDGIVADIGLSSYELDQSGRGISFRRKEPLDMRFDQSAESETAAWILNNKSERELEKLFREYGEEKFSRQISRGISNYSAKGGSASGGKLRISKIKYTTELYEIIKQSLPKPVRHRADDSARRIFQALRIAVNHELENLETFLPKAFDLLSPKGRLVIVSFHSLEDRMVKQFFQGLTKGCVCPPEFPICQCGQNPKGRLLTKKPVTVSAEELKNNPRSKPAKLRAIEKI